MEVLAFDLGGTWFRWGLYHPVRGLIDPRRVPAINYRSRPDSSEVDLRRALVDFVIERVLEMRAGFSQTRQTVSISLGACINARDSSVLGSGPLWGATAEPVHLLEDLQTALPEVRWHVVNDVTALLTRYMEDEAAFRKTMLITVSSGVGSRLYDHRCRSIPYDAVYGIQGEIGHLVVGCELGGRSIVRHCECGGLNHLNAFCSGRGIAETLRELPTFGVSFHGAFDVSPQQWQDQDDEWRLCAFRHRLEQQDPLATELLDACVTPLARVLEAALVIDPEIDRIVMTGGVTHGLGVHYRETLNRVLARDGLYQLTERDPQYVTRRFRWEAPDDFAGLRGAGLYAAKSPSQAANGE